MSCQPSPGACTSLLPATVPGTATAAARTRAPKRRLNPVQLRGDRVEDAALVAVMRAYRRRHLRASELDRGDLPGVMRDGGGGHERPVRVRAQ